MSTTKKFLSGSFTFFLSLLTATLIAHTATAESSHEEPAPSLEQIESQAVQRVDRMWLGLPFLGKHLGINANTVKQLPTKIRSIVHADWNPVAGQFTRVRTAFRRDPKQSSGLLPAIEWTTEKSPGLKIASKWSIAPQVRMPETAEIDRLSNPKFSLQDGGPGNEQVKEEPILLDVALAYQASEDLDISLSVENLSNEEVLEIVPTQDQRREASGRYVGLAFNYRF